jgi:hypothetical protein
MSFHPNVHEVSTANADEPKLSITRTLSSSVPEDCVLMVRSTYVKCVEDGMA